MKFQFTLILFALILTNFVSFAQETDTLKAAQLEYVVVSANRTETKKSNTPQSITVINKDAIALTPSSDFTDIIKKNASVNVIQYPGLSSGVGIRGFRPQFSGLNQRTLMLVDGRPAGTANLSTINSDNIERIEILKGPASALYGAQAMGGVVNIITKRSSGVMRTNAFAEYGSFRTLKAGGSVGGNINKQLDFDVSFNRFDRDRNMKLGKDNLFRKMLNSETAVKNYSDNTSIEVDDSRADGLRRQFTRMEYGSETARFGYQISKKLRADVSGEHFSARNIEVPSDIFYGNARPSSKDIDKYSTEASISGKFAKHQLSLRGYLSSEANKNRDLQSGGVFIAPFVSFRSTAKWKGVQLKDVYSIGQQSIIAGIDYNDASTTSKGFTPTAEKAPFSPNYNLATWAAYVQGHFSLLDNSLIVNPGIRYDLITYNVKQTPLLTTYAPGKETNPFISPSLAAQYTVLNLLTVHGTIGRAFVTPDAYNVAGYSELVNATTKKASVTIGNAGLKNESSTSWDAGLRFNKRELGISADVTYFKTEVKDRITTLRTTPTGGEKTESGYLIASSTTYVNANRANIEGLEAEFSYDFGALNNYRYSLKVFANATRTFEAEEVTVVQATGAETFKDIYNVANFTSTYGIEYNTLKGLDFRITGRYVGERKDTDFSDVNAPEIVYPSFMTLDFGASYIYAKKHTVSLLANNLTDENYYEKRGFNLQGRSFSLRYALSF
ncbi:MAG TPA: TonB-dependent receptor [Pedobacter sp.]|jgi:vitamin B12 transporter